MFNFRRFTVILAQKTAQLTGAIAVNAAKKNVRVDSRNLQNTITLDQVDSDTIEVFTEEVYAAMQEFGPANQPGREAAPGVPKSGPGGPYTFNPFMRPAAKEAVEKLPESVRRAADIAARAAT